MEASRDWMMLAQDDVRPFSMGLFVLSIEEGT